HAKDNNPEAELGEDDCMVIAIRSTQLKDPLALVATLAHELGHVILLGGRLLDPKSPDHEPLTDLLTVFLGLGIFTANCAGRFRQYQDEARQGWSMQRLGYLPEEVYGYALAKFAAERGEPKSEWVEHLSTNVRAYFKQSRNWLLKNHPYFGEAIAGNSSASRTSSMSHRGDNSDFEQRQRATLPPDVIRNDALFEGTLIKGGRPLTPLQRTGTVIIGLFLLLVPAS